MRTNSRLGLYIIAGVFIFIGCKKSDTNTTTPPVITPVDTVSNPVQSPTSEGFEIGAKEDYTPSTITLSTGKWSFDNAVIGTSADDKKNGVKSARIQETGKLTMNFDIVGGVYRLAIASAVYGTDGPSTWQLWASSNSGVSYSQVGVNMVTSGATLQYDTIVIATVDKVRFSIRKVSGGSSRLNIDDLSAILTSGPLAPNTADDNNMLLGNPDNCSPSPLNINHYYMDKGYYALSYSKDLGISNWVSWHLGASDLGSTPRQNDFREDNSLPGTWYHVSDASYTGSGFNRGHQCPSNDRTISVPANSSTFLMTNMLPQAGNVNQGPWEKFEDTCNTMISQGKEVYIICGSYGVGGVGNNGLLNSIDNDHVSVPAHLWKIAVVLTNGNGDISRINASTRVIAVDMPNDNTIPQSSNWKTFRTSVDALEAVTGYNFLSNLPDAIQLVIENHVDNL